MDTPRFGPHNFPHRPNGSTPTNGSSNGSAPLAPPSTAQMLTRRLVWSLVGVGLMLFVLYTMGLGPRSPFRRSTPPPPRSDSSPALPVVQAVTPRVGLDDAKETLVGKVEPFDEVVVRVPSSGFLKWMAGRQDQVRKGDVLAEIEKPGLEGDLAQTEADLEYARALLIEAQAKADVARDALTRAGKDPAARAKAQGEATVAEAHVRVCRADVKVKETRLRQLTQQSKSRKIIAPISGAVQGRSVPDGAWIDAEGPGGRRVLLRIGSIDVARVVFQVPGSLVAKLARGTVVQLHKRGNPKTVAGTVVAVEATKDPRSRRVEVRVVNDEHLLQPDAEVETTVTYKARTASLWVPAEAVIRSSGTSRVLVLEEQEDNAGDFAIHYRTIREGLTNGPEIQALSGLRGSERLVKEANENLTEGLLVKVKPAKKK